MVSGFNVGIVSYIIALFLKLLRLPREIRISLTIVFLVIYCFATGASNPVVRATIMGVIFISAYLFKREPDVYNSLAIAALFILMHRPYQLFDAGFQLSFASVASIISIYPKMQEFLRAGSLKIRPLRYMLKAALVSLSAWLGTMGFIACYFRIFSPVTVLANLFIVPLAALITLCGLSLIFISFAIPALTPFFACVNELLAALLINANCLLIKLPVAYFALN